MNASNAFGGVLLILSVGLSYPTIAASIIVPQEISYSYGDFSLTREMGASGGRVTLHEIGVEEGSSQIRALTSIDSTERAESDIRTEAISPVNLGEELGAALGGSLMGAAGATIGSVLGGVVYSHFCPEPVMKTEKHRERQHAWQTANISCSARTDARHSNSWSFQSENSNEQELYGNWHLKFSVVFKGTSAGKRYRIGENPKVWIIGLSRPVRVGCPSCQGKDFGIDGVRCPLDVEIRDTKLLREVSNISACAHSRPQAWQRLSVEVRASDFPVFSVETGRNIFEEQSSAMWEMPTTSVSLEYGEAAACSPWQVCRRESGGERAKVTLRKALDAINCDAAARRRIATNTFCFANGRLVAISEMPLVFLRKRGENDFLYWGVRTLDEDGNDNIGPVGKALLDRPVGDYEKVSFVRLSLAQTVRTVFSNETLLAGIKTDMVAFLSEPGNESGRKYWDEEWSRLTLLKRKHEARLRKPEMPAGALRPFSVDGVKLTFVYCPSNGECRAFWIGQTEVTQLLWKRIMGSNPSCFNADGDNRPVENVTVGDCNRFMQRLALKTGIRFRLPTAREWERACRAGSVTNTQPLGDYAWYEDNAQETTHPVRSKCPNAWGIYDMLGNVLEFTADMATDGTVLCGGSYLSGAEDCHASFRDFILEGSAPCIGIRMAMDAE